VPTCRSSAHHPSSGRHRSACASLVASFAAGVMVSNGGERYGGHAGVLIATFRCAARRGAFADARRVMAGDAGGRARKRAFIQSSVAVPICRRSVRHPTSGGRPPTSVCGPGRVVRLAGAREVALERMTAIQARRLTALRSRSARALRRVRR
jgi:hypothetical protein